MGKQQQWQQQSSSSSSEKLELELGSGGVVRQDLPVSGLERFLQPSAPHVRSLIEIAASGAIQRGLPGRLWVPPGVALVVRVSRG